MAKRQVPTMLALEEAAEERNFALAVSGLRHSYLDLCSDRLKDVALTPALMYFVYYVGMHDGCAQREMNEALCIDEGYSTRSVAKLVDLGLLEQRPNPNDRRSKLLQLTDEGRSSLELARRTVNEWNEKVLACLSDEEQNTLYDLLGRVILSVGDFYPESQK